MFLSQRLEESVLSEEKKLTVRGPSPDGPPSCLPARVREIVTKNLSDGPESPGSVPGSVAVGRGPGAPCVTPVAGAMSSVSSLQEENRALQGELARLEDLLAHSRADRDELAIKYGAISERVRPRAPPFTHHAPGAAPDQTSLLLPGKVWVFLSEIGWSPW